MIFSAQIGAVDKRFVDRTASIEIGETRSGSQKTSERWIYEFEALAGRTYLLEVAQGGLDLVLFIESPDGESYSLDSPLQRNEREFLLIERASRGAHRITLSSDEYTGASSRHIITITELSDDSRPTIDGWRLMTQGAVANHEGGQAAWEKAAGDYVSARAAWQSAGDSRIEAQAAYSAAFIQYWQLFDWVGSSKLASEAAELYGSLGEQALQANAMQLQAAALIESANEIEQPSGASIAPEAKQLFENALGIFDTALELQKDLGRSHDVGHIVNNIGLTYYYMGDFDRASDYWAQAAGIFRQAKEWTGEATALGNLGVADMETGRLTRSASTQERIIALFEPGRRDGLRARALDNLGISYRLLGRFDEALRAHSKALKTHRAMENPNGEAISLIGIAQNYFAVGDLPLANRFLEEALPLAEQTNDGRVQEAALRYLGNIAFLDGRYEGSEKEPGSLERHTAALAHATSPPDRAHLELLIARDLRKIGRTEAALERAEAALEIAQTVGSDMLLAAALAELGLARLYANKANEAIEPLTRAARLFDSLNMQNEKAHALSGLALVARTQGNLELAAQNGTAAIETIENIRADVADPELRALYAARQRDYYDAQIDVLMSLDGGKSGAAATGEITALEFSERARARLMADLLGEAAVDLRRNVDPVLSRRRDLLIERLAESRQQRQQILRSPHEQDSAADDARAAGRQLAAIETELRVLEAEIRTSNSASVATIVSADVMKATAMQAMLDDESVLLQYFLGQDRSFAWVVTSDSIETAILADRATIEHATRAAIESLKTFRTDSRSRQELQTRLDRLSELVLKPLPDFTGRRQLILAADGGLQYVPFAVLPAPDNSGRKLVDLIEILSVPSLSVVGLQRQREFETPNKTLAVIADPIFDTSDPRFIAGDRTETARPPDPESLVLRDGESLARLPSTGVEAEILSSLVAPNQRLIATGFAANRDTVLRENLDQYRYVHFATHGLIDTRYPALSALALATVDSSGNSMPGYLRLNDIYNLRLNADVVVLSACDTALGREIRGEGMLGLTQGFLYAGARTLVVSLWPVPDRATAELMERFYQFLLDRKMRPSAALRRAQQDLASDRRWRDEYFWGAMTVLGDWQ